MMLWELHMFWSCLSPSFNFSQTHQTLCVLVLNTPPQPRFCLNPSGLCWVWGLPWSVPDSSGLQPVKKMGLLSPSSNQISFLAGVGFMLTFSTPLWDFVWLGFVQVLCMWVHMCTVLLCPEHTVSLKPSATSYSLLLLLLRKFLTLEGRAVI